MGFFTKPESGAAGALEPLTHERLTALMDAREMNYGVDDDGDIGGFWDGHLFYFFRLGEHQEMFQVRGRWNRVVGVDQLPEIAALVNQWNADKIWPKAYVKAEGDEVGVYGEHSVDYEYGLTDDQIYQHISCALGTTLRLFEHLDEHYPEAAAAARAREESED